MNTQRSAFLVDLSTNLWSLACGVLCTSRYEQIWRVEGRPDSAGMTGNTAIVSTPELQRLFGRNHAALVAKQDDKEQKNDF